MPTPFPTPLLIKAAFFLPQSKPVTPPGDFARYSANSRSECNEGRKCHIQAARDYHRQRGMGSPATGIGDRAWFRPGLFTDGVRRCPSRQARARARSNGWPVCLRRFPRAAAAVLPRGTFPLGAISFPTPNLINGG